MPAIRQRAALIASLSAWPLLTLPLPTHATPPVQAGVPAATSSATVQTPR